MFTRIAACAALLVLCPLWMAQAGDVLSSTQPVAAAAHAHQARDLLPDTQAEKQAAVDPATYAAMPVDRPGTGPARSPNDINGASQPFGLDAKPVATTALVAKWNAVEAAIHADAEILARCRNDGPCPQAARRFLAIIDAGRARSGRSRIGVINRAINLAIVPTSDWVQWGVADHWSAPLETFTTQRGDCEDYAIAKYVALRAADVAEADVKLIVVRNVPANEDHAVVAVRLDGVWTILDNRWLALVRDRDIWRAIPRFVLDEAGVREFELPQSAGSARRLPQLSKT